MTFLTHLRLTGGSMGDSKASVTLDILAEHLSPAKSVHGGVIFSMCDTAMGMAIWSTLAKGETTATISASIDYLAPALSGSLTCEAEVTSRGRRIAFAHAVVTDAGGKRIAQSSGSFTIGKASAERAGKVEGEPVEFPAT